jgi:outer membrane protein OmpA-like peptidoglycan-associated protein
MIDLVMSVLAGAGFAQPPAADFFVCPGPDPRCARRPPEIVYKDCPDGSRVAPDQSCPVLSIRPFVIYFGANDTGLVDRARASLDEVVNAYRSSGSSLVLSGHTDRVGSAEANVERSQRYVNQVRDYLLASGVALSAITTHAYGESRPAVETADDVSEPDNRRVEITFGPPAGQ